MGDEAWVGLGGVDAVLVEVQGKTGGGQGEGGGGGKERVCDGGGVGDGRGQGGEVVSQHRRRDEDLAQCVHCEPDLVTNYIEKNGSMVTDLHSYQWPDDLLRERGSVNQPD